MKRLRAMTCILLIGVSLVGCARSPEARRDKHLARGKELFEQKDYSRALLEYRGAMQAVPNDAEPYYRIALASLATGDLTTALASLRRALDRNPKHAGARLKLAEIMSLSNEEQWVKEAEDRLRSLVQDNGASSGALSALALTELKLGKTGAAMATLEKALAAAPQELAISASLARVKLMANDVAGAEAVLKNACEKAPKASQPRVMLGLFYASRDRMGDAESEFRRALAIDGNDPGALFNLARLNHTLGRKQEAEEGFRRVAAFADYKNVYAVYLFEQGRRDESVREFEKLFKANPDDRQARTRLVAAYRAVNRAADAAAILGKALKENPKDTEALLQRAETLLGTGEYALVETDLNTVARLQPESYQLHYLLARLHKGRRQTQRYKQELSEALRYGPFLLRARIELAQQLMLDKEYGAASDLLKAAPEPQKKTAEFIVQRNWLQWVLGDWAAMRKGIDEGLAVQRAPDLLIQDGLWKLRAGNIAGARAALEEALNLNPADIRAMEALRASYAARKEHKVALQKIREYAARQPRSAPLQEFLGLMLVSQGDRGEARRAFDSAKAADPKFVRADLSLIQVDLVEGKFDDAQRRLEGILKDDGANTLARMWLGNLHAMRGNHKTAIEHLRQVVTSDSRNAQAMNNLAYLLAETGSPASEAVKYAQKAKELDPASAEYSDTLGWILYRQGLYPMAVKELERAAAAGKGSPVWKYHLAMAYAKAGDLDRGRAALKTALASNPNLPEAKLARELLGETK